MDQNPRTGLDRETVMLWTAIFGFLKELLELVIKAVSYARCNSKLPISVSSQG